MIDRLIQYDKSLMLFLNGMHNAFFDKIMWVISARDTWIPLYIALLVWLIWKSGKTSVYPILFALVAVGLSDFISVHAFKEVFHRLRPCHDPEIGQMMHLLHHYCGGLYGFVSSHAADTFSLAVFLSLVIRSKWFAVCMIGWAAVVSYSRIYLGVHYPGDILGGALLGSFIAYMSYQLLLRFLPKGNNTGS